jgi:hypothetical protein|tara:strand:+ start:329 stop:1327 length:999 start_codon:yes stop_codon:yes gene_type:complete
MTTTSSTSTTPSTSTPTFSFSSFPRVHPVDWNLLERVPSPEDIVRLHDVDGLELIVEDIIRGDFSSSSSSFLPPLPRDENDNNGDDDDDENKKKAKLKEKAFRLAQLLVEYLLFVQDVLVERKTASQIENDKLKTELEVWVRRAKEEREKRKALQNTTRANKKEDEKEEKEEEEAGVVVEELKGKLKETMDALERARAELEEFKRQQKAAVAGGNEDERGNRKSGKENSVEANGGKNNGSNAAAAAAAGGVDKTQYSGKLRQEVKNLLVRVGAKSAGKLSDRNTARSFGKLQKIIESESNSSDRSAAERRKYQETSRTLHLTLVNGESFQVI